ncbi:phage terminase large subunit [Mesorhizobium sp. YIM 152430]|uniref:phage terminase large subunit n=1 Tax=Mesorhizobium sp. YIM 152430 TaxID=3031761 RepID=UPI0023D9A072|nr:phage terminase large subunit [Mesorhizobium sp. YIM 152430]MDF1599711.1 phage terminase large subunit [Mesorhizobium sp. YIM 152430]
MMRLIRQERARRQDEAERNRVARDAERIRERCQTLSGFVREAWHVLEPTAKLVWNWHLDAICEHLEAVTDGRITRLLVNVPPGSSKSMLVAVMWQAWEWGPKDLRSMRYLTTSFNDGPVKRDTRKCRDLMLSDWYRALWPEVVLTRTGETSFANSSTGTREGVAFGSLTSQRGDRLVIDDPHSTETAESATERLATTRKFREGAQNRLNDQEKSAIVIIMQRLHEEDVSGVIEEIGMDYVHLMLPMEFEPERACQTEIGFRDPRTYEGELLDPARFPAEAVAKLKRDMGSYAYAGQYQQRPAPRSGGMFQRSDFEVVDAVPAGARRCRAWDFAASKEKPGRQPDWTVGLLMAHHKGTFYVEDVERGRWSAGEVETKLKNIATQDGLSVTIRMPQDPGSAGKADAATKTKLLAGHAVKVLPVTGDKATRAKGASAQAEAGNVKVVRGRWNELFLDEVCSFPNAQFDDHVDAFADALNELALGSTFTLDNL